MYSKRPIFQKGKTPCFSWNFSEPPAQCQRSTWPGANLKVYWEEWQLNTYQKYIAIYQNGHLKVVTPAFDRFKLIQSPKSQKITRYVVQIRSSSTKKNTSPQYIHILCPSPTPFTPGEPPRSVAPVPTSHCCPRSWRPRCWEGIFHGTLW